MIDVHHLVGDEFGAAVAEGISRSRKWTQERSDSLRLAPSLWPRSRVQLVSTNDDGLSVLDTIDSMAFNLTRPWLPIVTRPRSFRVGPLIVPGVTGCYRCYRSRQYQHGRLTGTDRKIESRPRGDHDVLVSGFLPAHAALATHLVQRDLDALLSDEVVDRAGRMTTVRWVSLSVEVGKLTRVDGCERCGAVRSEDSTWRVFHDAHQERLVAG